MAKTSFTSINEYIADQPAAAPLVAAFKAELAPYELSHKGTIRVPLSEPIPVTLIAGIAKFRAKEVAAREKAKTAAPKKRSS